MIEMFRAQQENLLRGVITGLLAQISQDYNLDNKELLDRYMENKSEQAQIKNGDTVPAPILVLAQQEKTRKKRVQKEKPDKVCCKGITAKGQPCKFAALTDGFCKKHSDANNKTDGVTRKQVKKTQDKPRHTHLTEEEPLDTCQVCDQQGNVIQPEMPRQDWEIKGADEIKARLARMLADADEPEPDQEQETVTTEELLDDDSSTVDEEPDEDIEARLKNILAEESEDEDEDED